MLIALSPLPAAPSTAASSDQFATNEGEGSSLKRVRSRPRHGTLLAAIIANRDIALKPFLPGYASNGVAHTRFMSVDPKPQAIIATIMSGILPKPGSHASVGRMVIGARAKLRHLRSRTRHQVPRIGNLHVKILRCQRLMGSLSRLFSQPQEPVSPLSPRWALECHNLA